MTSEELQAAIDECRAQGGGVVYAPSGTYSGITINAVGLGITLRHPESGEVLVSVAAGGSARFREITVR